MLSKDRLVRLGAAAILLAMTGCKKEPESKLVTPPINQPAPRFIPIEQLPIQQEGSGFIRYRGYPSAAHLQYIEMVCGRLQLSQQAPDLVIGTEYPNCVDRIRSRRQN